MRQPYDNHGRFVPLDCRNPACGYGKLRLEHAKSGIWECDKELEVCTYAHFDGDPWPQPFGHAALLPASSKQPGAT